MSTIQKTVTTTTTTERANNSPDYVTSVVDPTTGFVPPPTVSKVADDGAHQVEKTTYTYADGSQRVETRVVDAPIGSVVGSSDEREAERERIRRNYEQ